LATQIARPLDGTHRIAFGVQQGFQIGLQAGIVFLLLFSPSTLAPEPLPWGKELSCLYLSPSYFDRIFGDPCFSCHQDKISALFGFQRQKLPPLLLIEQLMHLLLFFCPIVLLHAQKFTTSLSFGQLVCVRLLSAQIVAACPWSI
jgi:hypothetical protein